MANCDGTYVRQSGRGFTYRYRACWTRSVSGSVIFDSTVQREGLVIARPRGQLDDVAPGEEDGLVRKAIESAVEDSVIE